MRWRLKDRLAASESSVVQPEDVMPASFGHPSWCPHLHSIHETSDRRLLLFRRAIGENRDSIDPFDTCNSPDIMPHKLSYATLFEVAFQCTCLSMNCVLLHCNRYENFENCNDSNFVCIF
ncbi:hypothetical protein CDAR_15741 [Caerostris darwini]|uniref:Uncharacterized protein n=1 Tax=Caerostris darwini TaxID=1538125 RepID=A0AAV4N9R2_9ARAC|nr:hypothetical protein CDAR_15741 [Caerostris darwini]